jgi:hypothetical protein
VSIEDQIEAVVRRVLAEELKARGLAPATYSSVALPPDLRSADRFHRLVRKCPGARKVGRVWTVPADQWHAYRSGKTAAPADGPSAVDRVLARYRATA